MWAVRRFSEVQFRLQNQIVVVRFEVKNYIVATVEIRYTNKYTDAETYHSTPVQERRYLLFILMVRFVLACLAQACRPSSFCTNPAISLLAMDTISSSGELVDFFAGPDGEALYYTQDGIAVPLTCGDVLLEMITLLHVENNATLAEALAMVKTIMVTSGDEGLLQAWSKLRRRSQRALEREEAQYQQRRAQRYTDSGEYQICVVCHSHCKSHCRKCKDRGIKTYLCPECWPGAGELSGCHMRCGSFLKGEPYYCYDRV